jgi:hypothetical protein
MLIMNLNKIKFFDIKLLGFVLISILIIGLMSIDKSGVNWDEMVDIDIVEANLVHVLTGTNIGPEIRNHGVIFHFFSELIFILKNYLDHLVFSRPLQEFLPLDAPDRFIDNPSLLARLRLKHVLVFLSSFLAYAGTAGIVANVLGRGFRGLAILLLALFPAWWGQTYFNQKDIPFASAFTLATFLGARLLDRYIQAEDGSREPLIPYSIAYGILIGLLTGLRLAGCFILFFFIVSHFILIYPRLRGKTWRVLYSYRDLYGSLSIYWALTTLVIHPASWYHPLTPLGWFVKAMFSLSKYSVWDNLVVSVQGGGQAAREIESVEEPSFGSREGEVLPFLEARIASVINSKTFRF